MNVMPSPNRTVYVNMEKGIGILNLLNLQNGMHDVITFALKNDGFNRSICQCI